eukprot:8686725-Pyramimonas_sp.AAC.1
MIYSLRAQTRSWRPISETNVLGFEQGAPPEVWVRTTVAAGRRCPRPLAIRRARRSHQQLAGRGGDESRS